MSATVIPHNTQVEKIATFRKVDPNNCTRFYAASFFRRIRKLEIIITIYYIYIYYILLRLILNGFWHGPIHIDISEGNDSLLVFEWHSQFWNWGPIKMIVTEFFYGLLLYESLGSQKNQYLLRYDVDKFAFWILLSYVIRYF